MPGYWWSCTTCDREFTFEKVTDSKSICQFIWDRLLPADWNQKFLTVKCPECETRTVKLAYDFPRRKRKVMRVNHIVGLNYGGGDYLQMMWEAVDVLEPKKALYDFKYLIRGRGPWGLNKPAVFTKGDLAEILELYRKKVRRSFLR
jgi:hypothetical protein